MRTHSTLLATALSALAVASCRSGLPAKTDLRERLVNLQLPPRPQGGRGTCSIFTTCSALEFALARATGTPARLSTEYLNWSAARASGAPSDGNFFHNAIAGFQQFGICKESSMPYRDHYDPAFAPPPAAASESELYKKEISQKLAVHWIVPWEPNRFGVNDLQFAEIQKTLARGYPVAAGSGHSRLLVGYRNDPAAAGGGVFITEDSALNAFSEVTYEFVKKEVADVFWIEATH